MNLFNGGRGTHRVLGMCYDTVLRHKRSGKALEIHYIYIEVERNQLLRKTYAVPDRTVIPVAA